MKILKKIKGQKKNIKIILNCKKMKLKNKKKK